MESFNELELQLIRMNQEELIGWCMSKNILKNELACSMCHEFMKLTVYKRHKDMFAWRCNTRLCRDFTKYKSIRVQSFFEEAKNTSILLILRIILRYASGTPKHAIIQYLLPLERKFVYRICGKLTERIPEPNFESNKLGGFGKVVQVDETMLNFKCKSHRGRSPTNRTDSISIIEFGSFTTRVFAKVIPNKESATLIPIICSQVAANSTIWTDEHRSYSCLSRFNFQHGTVCHKYNFINHDNNVNTQAVESFNNLIKRKIKERMGVETFSRTRFLNEICWFYNNSTNILSATFNLIKIN